MSYDYLNQNYQPEQPSQPRYVQVAGSGAQSQQLVSQKAQNILDGGNSDLIRQSSDEPGVLKRPSSNQILPPLSGSTRSVQRSVAQLQSNDDFQSPQQNAPYSFSTGQSVQNLPQQRQQQPALQRVNSQTQRQSQAPNLLLNNLNGDRVVELQTKVRNLEIQVIDLKSDQTQQLYQIADRLQQKLDTRMTTIESQVQQAFPQQNQKREPASLSQVQGDQLLKQLQQLTVEISNCKAHNEKTDLNFTAVTQQINSLHNGANQLLASSGSYTQQNQMQQSPGDKLSLIEVDTELKFLRTLTIQEQNKREQQFNECSQLINGLQALVQKAETENLMNISKARDDHLSVLVSSNDEKQAMEQRTRDQVDLKTNVISQAIQQVDRKLDDEIVIRQRTEDDIRSWFEQRLNILNQQKQQDAEQQIEREKRLMHQISQGMQSISEVIKQVKDQQALSVKEVSDATQSTIQSTMTKVDGTHEVLTRRATQLESALADLSLKMDTIQEQALKHARLTNETLGKEMARTEKIMSTLEQFCRNQIQDIRADASQLTTENQQWQVNFEDVQSRKILEIQNAIKVLNQNYTMLQTDSKDKFGLLEAQVQASASTVAGQIKDIKVLAKGVVVGGAPVVSPSNKYNTTNGINEPLEKVGKVETFNERRGSGMGLGDKRNSLEQTQIVMNTDNLGSISHEAKPIDITAIQFKLNEFQREIEQKVQEQIRVALLKSNQQKQETDTLLEGRANEFTISIEKRLLGQIQLFKDQLTMQRAQRTQEYDSAIKKLNEATQKFFDEYEAKYVKAQLREEELRSQIGQLIKEESFALQDVLQEKLRENEQQLVRLQLRNGGAPVGSGVGAANEVDEQRGKANEELIISLVNNSKTELQKQITQQCIEVLDKKSLNHSSSTSASSAQIDDLHSKLSKTDKQLNDKLEAEIAKNVEEILELKQLIFSLESQLDDMKNQLQKQVKAQEQTVKTIDATVQKVVNPLFDEFELKLATLNTKMADVQAESEEVKQSSEAQIGIVIANQGKTDARIKDLGERTQSRIEEQQKSVDNHSTELQLMQTQMNELLGEVNSLLKAQNENDQVAQLLHKAEEQEQKLGQLKNQLQSGLDELEAKLDDKNQGKTQENLQKQVDDLESQVLQLTQGSQNQVNKEQINEDINKLKNRVNDVEGQLDGNLKAKIQQVQDLSGEIDKRLDTVEKSHVEHKKDSNQKTKNLQDSTEQQSKDVKELQQSIDTLKAASGDKDSLQKKFDDLEQNFRSIIKGELEDIQDKLKKVENETDTNTHQVAQQKEQIDAANEALTEVRSSINMMTSILGELEQKQNTNQ